MTLAGSISGTVGSNNWGHADGVGTAASFRSPSGVSVNVAGTVAIVVSLTVAVRARNCKDCIEVYCMT